MIKNKFALIPITLVLLTAITALADKLVINSNQSNPVGKALFTKIVEDFKKQNPDLEIVFNTTTTKVTRRRFETGLRLNRRTLSFGFQAIA